MIKPHQRKLFFFLLIVPLPLFAKGPWLSESSSSVGYFNSMISASSDSSAALTLEGNSTTQSSDLLEVYEYAGGQKVANIEQNGKANVTGLRVLGTVKGATEEAIPTSDGYGQNQRGLIVLQPNTPQLGHQTAFRYQYADGVDLYGMAMQVLGTEGDVALSFSSFYNGTNWVAQNNCPYILRTDNSSQMFRISGCPISSNGAGGGLGLGGLTYAPQDYITIKDGNTLYSTYGNIGNVPYPTINLLGVVNGKNTSIVGVHDASTPLSIAGSSPAQIGDLLEVYNYSGGAKKFSVSAGGAVSAGSMNTSSTLSSTKPCASGYTRVGPNYCERNSLNAGEVFNYTVSCRQSNALSGVSDAKGVELLITNTITGKNSVGSYNTAQIDFFPQSNSACESQPINKAQDTVREWTAVSPDTVIAVHTHQIKIGSNAEGQFRYRTNLTGGITTSVHVQRIGYYD